MPAQCRYVVFLLLLGMHAAHADTCWRELEFDARRGFLGASMKVNYESLEVEEARKQLHSKSDTAPLAPRSTRVGWMRVEFEAFRSKGVLQLWYEPDTRAALQMRRMSSGRDSRLKLHRFHADGVVRTRYEGEPEDLSRVTPTRRQMLPYPIDPASRVVSASVSLLEFASELVRSASAEPTTHLVFTDKQLYNVELVPGETQMKDVEFTLVENGATREIERETSVQSVEVKPWLLGDEPEDEPFTLFELGGDITIFIETGSGLPVKVKGSWKPIGSIPASLNRAVVAPGCIWRTSPPGAVNRGG